MSATPGELTPAEAAVRDSGVAVEDVCRRARVGRRYLARLLRDGAPYDTAERLAMVLGCRIEVFLPHRAVGTPGRRDRGRGGCRPSPAGR